MLKSLRGIFVAGAILSVVSPAYAADTVLNVWANLAPDASSDRGAALKHVLDAFEAAHPGVKVKVTTVDYLDMSPALLRAARAKQTPDLAMLYSPFLRVHIAAGSIQPLDKYMTDDVRKNVIALPVAQKDGKTYGLPWEVRPMGYLYRADLFAKVGVPNPQTNAELIGALKKIRAEAGIEGYGISFDPVRSIGALEWFVPMAVGMGAKILNDDGSAAFNDPAIIRLLEAYRTMVNDDKVVDQQTLMMSDDETQQRMEAGQMDMIAGGTMGVNEVRENSGLGDSIAWAPAPAFDAGHPTPVVLEGWILVMPTASPQPDLAWQLIQHWTSPEMQRYQAEAVGYMPGNRKVMEDPTFNPPDLATMKRAQDAINNNGVLDFNWPDNSELLNDVVARMVTEAISGKLPIPDAIAKAEKSYNSRRN